MCGSKRNPWLFGLGMLLAVLVVYGGRAQADISSDRAGSVVIFPKVISDGTRDTIIQIANTKNDTVQANCIYIDSTCFEINFDIFLTKQQPTVWLASLGRSGSDTNDGFSPGHVLPTQPPFAGQLICVQVGADGIPIPGNALKGEAIIFPTGEGRTISDVVAVGGEISEYNAISVLANNAGSNILDFNATGGNATGATGNYNACPAHLVMNHYAEGTVDDFTGGTASTELTLIPCTALLEEQLPVPAVAQFQIVDEMEFTLTASTPFSCFLNINLGLYFGGHCSLSPTTTCRGNPGECVGLGTCVPGSSPFSSVAGHTNLKTRITPATGTICYTGTNAGLACASNTDCPLAAGVCTDNVALGNCSVNADCGTGTCKILGCNPYPGLLGVAEEFQTRHTVANPSVPGPTGSAAVNLFMEFGPSGVGHPGDFIVLAP